MNIRNPQRAWIKSVLVLFLLVATYGVVACDDSDNSPGCNAVPADMNDDFFQNNSVIYFCSVNGVQVNYTLSSEITSDGVFCTLLYFTGELGGQGSGSITFSGEVDETGTLCDFADTEALLFVNLQSEQGTVDSGEAFFADPGDGRFLTFSADADFSIIGNFNWPPTECACIAVN
jgi:hypothetical protein